MRHQVVLNMERQYPAISRHSFDRFGDDLTELIASFLTLENKFRFECLCKQWQSVVFNKQKQLIIDHRLQYKSSCRVVIKRFEIVLKKCQNISSIDVNISPDNSDKVFETIINYCRYLREIRSDFSRVSDEIIEEFGHKFGSRLKTIDFKISDKSNLKTFNRIAELCPHSTTSVIDQWPNSRNMFSAKEKSHLFNNLKSFHFEFGVDDNVWVEEFWTRNRDNLQSVSVRLSPKRLNECDYLFLFSQLVQLKQIRRFEILFLDNSHIKQLAKFLKELSAHHSKLIHLKLCLSLDDHGHFLRIYNLMNLFSNLKSLELVNYLALPVKHMIAIQYFPKYCNNLVHLRIGGNCLRVEPEFFSSIGDRLPKLQSLSVTHFQELNRQSLEAMVSLSNLRSLRLTFNKFCISVKTLIEMTRICPKLVSIRLILNGKSCQLSDRDIFEMRAKESRFKLKWTNDKCGYLVDQIDQVDYYHYLL